MMSPQEATKLVAELNEGINKFEELRHYHELALKLKLELESACSSRDANELKITNLTRAVTDLQLKAGLYSLLVDLLSENEVLQPIWDELVVTMKLLNPELENTFKLIIRFGTHQ
jgi:hypothetical protein